ncbi:MAG: PQQ-binding-like beta-propeller repeat protein [Planctomycetota bacterium]
MDCQELQDDLELFVLGELPPARQAEIEAHLEGCPDCRTEEEQCRLLVREIKWAADKTAPNPDWERAVRSSVAAGIQAERRQVRARRVFMIVGAMAALLLIGLTLWGVWGAAENDSTGGAVSERWRYGNVRSAPASAADSVVVQGATMYLLRDDEAMSCVAAINTATGALQWQSDCRSLGYLAADRSRVFCLASDGSRTLDLAALNAADGKALWRYSQENAHPLHGACRPIPLDGDRVCWTADGAIHMLDAGTGRPIWTCPIADEGPLSSAAVRGDALYVVTGQRLHCLESDSGEESWREEFAEEMRGQGRPMTALADRRIYFVQTDRGLGSRLFCMDVDTRKLAWKKIVPGVRCLLAAGERIYLRGRQILALDAQTGDTLWACSAEGCGPLTLIDGLIHFVDSGKPGRLVALEQRTGRKAWEVAGIRSCDAFAKVGDTGYIKTQDGIVHALALCSAAGPGSKTAEKMK